MLLLLWSLPSRALRHRQVGRRLPRLVPVLPAGPPSVNLTLNRLLWILFRRAHVHSQVGRRLRRLAL